MRVEALAEALQNRFAENTVLLSLGEVTLEATTTSLLETMATLRDEGEFGFDQLIDICGVDYAAYGQESHASDGAFEGEPKLAVVYHLLSVNHNHRMRVRVSLDGETDLVPSMCELWAVANWFEREAFDMYGIIFEGHPDLRRLLTDYGFIGHPFRKDFPISGHVEMRYDEAKGRVVYQPVTVEPRVLVPRVIREDGYGG